MEEIVIFILLFFYESIFIQLYSEEIGIMKTLFANKNFIRIYDVSFSSSHICFLSLLRRKYI